MNYTGQEQMSSNPGTAATSSEAFMQTSTGTTYSANRRDPANGPAQLTLMTGQAGEASHCHRCLTQNMQLLRDYGNVPVQTWKTKPHLQEMTLPRDPQFTSCWSGNVCRGPQYVVSRYRESTFPFKDFTTGFVHTDLSARKSPVCSEIRPPGWGSRITNLFKTRCREVGMEFRRGHRRGGQGSNTPTLLTPVIAGPNGLVDKSFAVSRNTLSLRHPPHMTAPGQWLASMRVSSKPATI